MVELDRPVSAVRFKGFDGMQLHVRRIGGELVVRYRIPRYMRDTRRAVDEGAKHSVAFRAKVVDAWIKLRKGRGAYRNVLSTVKEIQAMFAAKGVKVSRASLYNWTNAKLLKGKGGLVDGRAKPAQPTKIGARGRVL